MIPYISQKGSLEIFKLRIFLCEKVFIIQTKFYLVEVQFHFNFHFARVLNSIFSLPQLVALKLCKNQDLMVADLNVPLRTLKSILQASTLYHLVFLIHQSFIPYSLIKKHLNIEQTLKIHKFRPNLQSLPYLKSKSHK